MVGREQGASSPEKKGARGKVPKHGLANPGPHEYADQTMYLCEALGIDMT